MRSLINSNLRTPLQVAVKENCTYDVTSCLLSFGADLNHQDVSGRTPLHTFFNESVRCILEFHQEDVDNTTQDSRGMNTAHYISWSKSSREVDLSRCCKGNISSLEFIDKEGNTAFHFACFRGNLELMEFLLNLQKAVTSQLHWKGCTPMHYATQSSRSVQAIDMLACRGFDLRAVDHKGRTPLHKAASGRSVAAVKRLLELGAAEDLNVLDNESQTPIQIAALAGRETTVDFLRPLYDHAQLLTFESEQKAMSSHGRDSSSKRGSRFIASVTALLSIGLLFACLSLRFIY